MPKGENIGFRGRSFKGRRYEAGGEILKNG